MIPKAQDAGLPLKECNPDAIVVYHTHGHRQYYGTAKLHTRLDCPVLVHWKPEGTKVGRPLGKTVMVEAWFVESLSEAWICGHCRRAGAFGETVAAVLARRAAPSARSEQGASS